MKPETESNGNFHSEMTAEKGNDKIQFLIMTKQK